MRIAACRSCGGDDLFPVIDLGEQPLANALPLEGVDEKEPIFELKVVGCAACSLVQLTYTVPPEVLFRNYLYFSSFSETVLANARASASRLIRERRLGPESLVVEVASNDGYLLQHFCEAGVPVLGVEPALNIAAAANARGIRTVPEFFGRAAAKKLGAEYGPADVVLANNVLAHVADLNGFVAGIAEMLKPEGLGVFEVPYLRDLVEKGEFDTIYHEHLCYFSVTALDRLVRNHGMRLAGVERIAIHGGSLRIRVTKATGDKPDATVAALLQEEDQWRVRDPRTYHTFAQRAQTVRTRLVDLLARLKSQGKTIAAYGAAAKGTVLLNYCGINHDTLDFVADKNPHKQGRRMPGVGVPVVAPDAILSKRPDVLVILAWNFADEIMRQQAAYAAQGGAFLLPIPEPRLVE